MKKLKIAAAVLTVLLSLECAGCFLSDSEAEKERSEAGTESEFSGEIGTVPEEIPAFLFEDDPAEEEENDIPVPESEPSPEPEPYTEPLPEPEWYADPAPEWEYSWNPEQTFSDAAMDRSEEYEWSAESDTQTDYYVLNTNTMKIHYPDCASAARIAVYNRAYTSDYAGALADGYVPCKNCNP